jgi:hypothetical protein
MKFYNILYYKSYKLAIELGNENFHPDINAYSISTTLTWMLFPIGFEFLHYLNLITGSNLDTLTKASFIYPVFTGFYSIGETKCETILKKTEIIVNKRKKTYSLLFVLFGVSVVSIYFWITR